MQIALHSPFVVRSTNICFGFVNKRRVRIDVFQIQTSIQWELREHQMLTFEEILPYISEVKKSHWLSSFIKKTFIYSRSCPQTFLHCICHAFWNIFVHIHQPLNCNFSGACEILTIWFSFYHSKNWYFQILLMIGRFLNQNNEEKFTRKRKTKIKNCWIEKKIIKNVQFSARIA